MAVFGRVGNWRVRTRSPSQHREHPSFFLSLCIFVRRAHTDHSHPLPFLTCFVARRTCHTPLLQSRCTYSKTLFPFHSTARRLSWPHRTFETANVCRHLLLVNTSTETVCVARKSWTVRSFELRLALSYADEEAGNDRYLFTKEPIYLFLVIVVYIL